MMYLNSRTDFLPNSAMVDRKVSTDTLDDPTMRMAFKMSSNYFDPVKVSVNVSANMPTQS